MNSVNPTSLILNSYAIYLNNFLIALYITEQKVSHTDPHDKKSYFTIRYIFRRDISSKNNLFFIYLNRYD